MDSNFLCMASISKLRLQAKIKNNIRIPHLMKIISLTGIKCLFSPHTYSMYVY